jgi:transcription-repair coupling factor (superfamily II helicase)
MQQINTTEETDSELYLLRCLFSDIPPFNKIEDLLKNKSYDKRIFNVIGASSSLIISLFSKFKENKLILVNGEAETQKIYANLSEILSDEDKRNLLIFPDSTVIPYEKISPPYDTTGEQLNVLYKLLTDDSNIIVAPIRSLFNPVISDIELKKSIINLFLNSEISLDNLRNNLISYGYSVEKSVERVGEISYRGGIIDIFSPTEKYPARIEFTGNIISSIRFFDPITQLSINKTDTYIIIPMSHFILNEGTARETINNIKDYSTKNKVSLNEIVINDLEKISQNARFSGIEHYFPFVRSKEYTLIDFFNDDSIVFYQNLEDLNEIIKSHRIEATEIYGIEREKKEVIPINFLDLLTETSKKIKKIKKVIRLDKLPLSETSQENYALPIRVAESILSGDFKGILNQYLSDKGTVLVATKQRKRVLEIIENLGFNLSLNQIVIEDLYLNEGFFYPNKKLALITDRELFGWKSSHKHYKRFKEGIPIKSIEDLKEGDILVHYSYGIGIYRGLTVVPDQDGNKKEFLLMEYSRGDKLYVPPERINMVNKYVGEPESLTLSSLGTAEWERVRERAKTGAKELAEELLKLYAQREISKGHSFSSDGPWQHELELSFPYEETPDQLAAIRDVKKDMEDKKIMDRIVTGDVGYGKTEVALRAAFKAINDSKQVALLVPTTILADQHYETFKERFAPYPIEIAALSRLVSPKKQKETIERLKEGKIDLIIGTHKILSRAIEYKRLGLLIIDEEHKFGVRHKEQIKKLRENIDVLTLTATPIPRTLSMAVSGIREISHIDTSPEGRKPVKTYVMPFDPDVVKDAIKFELARGGQVYYVHNRIQDILRVKEEIKKLLPDIRIAIAHGRMVEDEIDNSMTKFLKGEIDLLLCTTIIESGIDIPTVNTIIIEDADKLGLAQMYQLRGRVGRSTRRAYAYFFYPINKNIEKKAFLRLEAIKEFVELGSGLKIALRDLEIRGAGNFLGDEQHGYLRSVGYHLYIQLLKEAIEELKYQKGEIKAPLELTEFPISGYIPSLFIRDDGERLSIYQELVGAKNIEELRKLKDEFVDKYGVFPDEFDKFYENLELRIVASEKGLSSVKLEENLIFFNFNNERLDIKVDSVSNMIKKFGTRIRFKPEAIIVRKDNLEFIDIVRGVIECL